LENTFRRVFGEVDGPSDSHGYDRGFGIVSVVIKSRNLRRSPDRAEALDWTVRVGSSFIAITFERAPTNEAVLIVGLEGDLPAVDA